VKQVVDISPASRFISQTNILRETAYVSSDFFGVIARRFKQELISIQLDDRIYSA
jgi:hypothetical protein